jgi:hypothetical protein
MRPTCRCVRSSTACCCRNPWRHLCALPCRSRSFTLYRSDVVRRRYNAQSLLQRLGVSDCEAQAFLRNDPSARQLFAGRPGKLVAVETTDRHELQRLTARWLSR